MPYAGVDVTGRAEFQATAAQGRRHPRRARGQPGRSVGGCVPGSLGRRGARVTGGRRVAGLARVRTAGRRRLPLLGRLAEELVRLRQCQQDQRHQQRDQADHIEQDGDRGGPARQRVFQPTLDLLTAGHVTAGVAGRAHAAGEPAQLAEPGAAEEDATDDPGGDPGAVLAAQVQQPQAEQRERRHQQEDGGADTDEDHDVGDVLRPLDGGVAVGVLHHVADGADGGQRDDHADQLADREQQQQVGGYRHHARSRPGRGVLRIDHLSPFLERASPYRQRAIPARRDAERWARHRPAGRWGSIRRPLPRSGAALRVDGHPVAVQPFTTGHLPARLAVRLEGEPCPAGGPVVVVAHGAARRQSDGSGCGVPGLT